ncbi:MAG: GNAT family N-acetyltransferase [Bacteroidota bacterium]|nr:GNAT family N-acetyltransferase [Bacteroidota bacterium]
MIFFIETERLILRDLLPTDADGMFELDSNADVHRYLGNNPIKTIEETQKIIENTHQQYLENGIGRWATIEKSSGNFIGWSGLKFVKVTESGHTNYYDVGYRFIPQYWGKGYATESAKAALKYGFTELNLDEIIGTANVENIKSRRILEKCGLKFVEHYMWKDIKCDWLKITKEEWAKLNG